MSSFPNKIMALSPVDPAHAPGFYVLPVTHQADVPATTTETWKLDIIGLPTPLRVMGSVDQGAFKSLVPVGLCKGCPKACLPFHSCQPFVSWPFPWWKYVVEIVDLRWPIPPGRCLDCPRPWDNPVREGFDRVIVSVTPYVRPGEPLGAGKAREIDLYIRGGEPVGGLFDVGGGQYLQLIEYPRGSPPHLNAAAAGMIAAEMRVAPRQVPGRLTRYSPTCSARCCWLRSAPSVGSLRSRREEK